MHTEVSWTRSHVIGQRATTLTPHWLFRLSITQIGDTFLIKSKKVAVSLSLKELIFFVKYMCNI